MRSFALPTLDNMTVIDSYFYYILLSPVALFYSATFWMKMLVMLSCILII